MPGMCNLHRQIPHWDPELPGMPNSLHCCSGDEEEWREWKVVGDPVMHIELRRWADCLVIAPLSANTLAKVAQGLCDNLLTCVVRTCLQHHRRAFPCLCRHLARSCKLGLHTAHLLATIIQEPCHTLFCVVGALIWTDETWQIASCASDAR